MVQRVGLAQALINNPDLLILDEPTSGLDPLGRMKVRDIIKRLKNEGKTVFFSSHQIAEVDQIADHVAIIDSGRTVVTGVLDDLRQHYRRIQLVFDGDAPEPAFRAPGIERVRRKGRVLTVMNPMSVDVLPVTLKEIFLETVTEEN